MKIIVLSRAQAQVHVFDELSALIAITTPPAPPVEISPTPNIKATLWLQFADVHSADQSQAMQPDHARLLWKFIEDNLIYQINGSIVTIVVYCDAGASRSPSLALAVIDVMGWSRTDLVCKAIPTPTAPPNWHVYQIVLANRG